MAAYQYILLYSVGGGGRGGGVGLSLVWISKAVVSHIEDETMLLSVFYYSCVNILWFSLSPIHLSYVAFSRPDVACRNLTLKETREVCYIFMQRRI